MEVIPMQIVQNSYFLKPRISFYFQSDRLRVKIETERLYIFSYHDKDFEHCVSLYGDKKITSFFDHGRARTRSEVKDLILEKGNRYFFDGKPFGLFSIYCKEKMNFLGQVDLLPSGEVGVVEVGFILHEKYQNKGYCTEAVKALLFDYITELNFRGPKCEELPIYKVMATAHPLNQSSKSILFKVGMTYDKFQKRFDRPRMWYSMLIPMVSSIKEQKMVVL